MSYSDKSSELILTCFCGVFFLLFFWEVAFKIWISQKVYTRTVTYTWWLGRIMCLLSFFHIYSVMVLNFTGHKTVHPHTSSQFHFCAYFTAVMTDIWTDRICVNSSHKWLQNLFSSTCSWFNVVFHICWYIFAARTPFVLNQYSMAFIAWVGACSSYFLHVVL